MKWSNKIMFSALMILAILSGQAREDRLELGITPDFIVKKVADISITPKGSIWLTLRPDVAAELNDIFTDYHDAFKLGMNDRIDLMRVSSDPLGFTHRDYQQYYRGVLVEGARMLTHSKSGQPIRMNGHFVISLNLEIVPRITQKVALGYALGAVGAEAYMWEIPAMETLLQELKQDSAATYYPVAQLVIAVTNGNMDRVAENYRLAYKFDVYTYSPNDGVAIYVDVANGEVFRSVPLIAHSAKEATGTTLYNGVQSIITDYRTTSSDYALLDVTRGDSIRTRNFNFPYDDITDTDTLWNSNAQKPAVSAHWAAGMTYDYFFNIHSRDSFDGVGGFIAIYIDEFVDDAQWNGSYFSLGQGGVAKTSDDLVSLDIVGHEFIHALDQYSGEFVYAGESGALEESFGDIFGTMVEYYVEGDSAGNYLIAEDMWITDGFFRDMSDPHAGSVGKRQPNTYGTNDSFWCTDPGSCEATDIVHTNSGVQNYWFYLLAEGGSGTNENGDSYSVTAIGRDTVAAIAYRNLTQYLSGTMDYADAREGAIWAAHDLYGANEVTQVENAWMAVGVGPSLPVNITLENETVVDDTLIYVAGYTITAGPAYVIQSGQVLLLAKNSITLKPGFHAEDGSSFIAYVGAVTTPALPPTPTNLDIVNEGEFGEHPSLVWDFVSSATYYKIYRRSGGGAWGHIGSPYNNSYIDSGATLARTENMLKYYVTAVNSWGESGPSDSASTFGTVQKRKASIPSLYALHHAYPNPFNPTVTIRYDLPEPAEVQLIVYNLLGREVVRLVEGHMTPGYHVVLWHGRDATGRTVPSGMYIARLVTPNYVKSIKMILLK